MIYLSSFVVLGVDVKFSVATTPNMDPGRALDFQGQSFSVTSVGRRSIIVKIQPRRRSASQYLAPLKGRHAARVDADQKSLALSINVE